MKNLPFRFVLLFLVGFSLKSQAQSSTPGESLYYSRLQFAGPARTQGIAGANVALGGDFGNLTSNPAGLGFFRKSEFNFSPGLGLGSADAANTAVLSTSQNQTKNSFHIASVGLVFANRKADDDQSSNWRGGSFALGFSRVADFNTAFSYSNSNIPDNQSIFQYLREPGGYTNPSNPDYQSYIGDISTQGSNGQYSNLDGLAYGTLLTSFGAVKLPPGSPTDSANAIITTPRIDGRLPVAQTETVTRSGSVSQFDLGYGGSYKDRLYIGGGIGIVSSNSHVIRDFTETHSANTNTAATNLALHDDDKTTGTGINARLGVIYRASDIVRVGASIQTPTYIQFTDTYSESLTTSFSAPIPYKDANGNSQTSTGIAASSQLPPYVYSLTTPFRANGGIAVTLGKHGFVTGDIEYVGYQQARLSSDPSNANGDNYSFSGENQTINTAFQNAINLRFGTEVRFDIFRIRAGYAHYGDPYRNLAIDGSQQFYTLGAGFRQNKFFMDIAGVYTTFNQLYSPYTLYNGKQPVINVKANRYTTTVTAGFTF